MGGSNCGSALLDRQQPNPPLLREANPRIGDPGADSLDNEFSGEKASDSMKLVTLALASIINNGFGCKKCRFVDCVSILIKTAILWHRKVAT